MKYSSCTDYWLKSEPEKDSMSLRGDFEGMYQDIDDPWGCLEHSDSINNKLFLEMLFHKNNFTNVLDIGCGLGGLTNNLLNYNSEASVVGWDISETAIIKAKNRYPRLKFYNKNIIIDDLDSSSYELIILSEVLWYFLDEINMVFERITKGLTDDGIVGIHQYFPSKQKFGKKTIDGVNGFERFIECHTDLKFMRKVVSYHGGDQVLLAMLSKG